MFLVTCELFTNFLELFYINVVLLDQCIVSCLKSVFICEQIAVSSYKLSRFVVNLNGIAYTSLHTHPEICINFHFFIYTGIR